MRRTWTIIGVCCLAGLYLGVLLWAPSRAAGQSTAAQAGSSVSTTPTGSQSLATTWRQLGLQFSTWEQPPALLAQTTATWVSVAPDSAQYKGKNVQALLQFVRAGGHVVWAADDNSDLLSALGLSIVKMPAQIVHQVSVGPSNQAGMTIHRLTIHQLNFTLTAQLRGANLDHAKTFYRTQQGAVIGAMIQLGKGHIVVWTVPVVWENGAIGVDQNFALIWHIVGNQSLLWDEFGHGVQTTGMLAFMFGHGRAWTLVFVTLAVLLGLWASLVRVGQPRLAADDAPRLGTEYLDALARHLRSRPLRSLQFSLLTRVVQQRCSHRLGLSTTLPWPSLDERIAGTTLAPVVLQRYQRWRQLWQAAEANGKTASPQLFSATMALFQALSQPMGEKGERTSL